MPADGRRDSGHRRRELVTEVLHAPSNETFWWSETMWFSFFVAERRLSCTICPWFRQNLATCGCGIAIWDGTACAPWEMRYYDWQWQLPWPDRTGDTYNFANGYAMEALVPGRKYRLRYEPPAALAWSRREARFDVVF